MLFLVMMASSELGANYNHPLGKAMENLGRPPVDWPCIR